MNRFTEPGNRIVPVTVVSDPNFATELSLVLAERGVTTIEVTLRTPKALDCITAIREKNPEVAVGAGTVLSPGQAKQAVDAGAQFLVSPGTTSSLLSSLQELGVPFIPGFSTVSEAMWLFEAGVTEAKFFPAEQSGGTPFLGSLNAVLPNLKVFPTGGIGLQNLKNYLSSPNVDRVGGTWLSSPELQERSDWGRIQELINQTLDEVERVTRNEK